MVLLAFLMAGLAQAAAPTAPAIPASPATPPAATQTVAAPPVDRLSDEQAGKGLDLTAIAHSPADGSPYLGPADAPVVVNVFTDFQCPVCRRSADPIKQLAADFPGKVKVVVRHNALPMHKRAQAMALAAVAAGNQGKFWPYYDRLWASPNGAEVSQLATIATELQLDIDRWRKDVANPATLARVQKETDAATRLGATGTPAFFVNGMRQVGWGSYRDLRSRVEREIAASETGAPAGAPLHGVAEARIRQSADKNTKHPGEAAADLDDWVKVLLAP